MGTCVRGVARHLVPILWVGFPAEPPNRLPGDSGICDCPGRGLDWIYASETLPVEPHCHGAAFLSTQDFVRPWGVSSVSQLF